MDQLKKRLAPYSIGSLIGRIAAGSRIERAGAKILLIIGTLGGTLSAVLYLVEFTSFCSL